jgi:uracil-DNA glycosylase family 4
VILGEGPGLQEIKAKLPFVGPSGQLLNEGLPIDFVQEDALVLNAVRCHVSSDKKDAAKMLKAVNECRPRIFQEIGKYPRKLIIALGSWANISILKDPDFKITKRRGELLVVSHPGREHLGETVVVAPVLHPAFLLRGKGNLKQFRSDIALALDVLRQPEDRKKLLKYEEPTYQVLESARDVRSLRMRIEELLRSNTELAIATDIETSGFDHIKDNILCVGLYTPALGNIGWITKGDDLFEDVTTQYKTEVRLLLALPAKWVWHNGKFDVKFLRQNDIWANVSEDTLLISYALDEKQGGHDLESLAKDILKAPSYKGVLKQYLVKVGDSFANVPKPILYDYLAKDVKNTYGIYQVLLERVKQDKGLWKLYTEILLPATEVLIRTEMRGIHVDKGFVQENKATLEQDLILAQQSLNEVAGEYINPNSWQQVGYLLWDKRGLRLKGKRPTSTDKKILVKFKSDPAVAAIIKYRRIAKMLSTYVMPLTYRVQEDGRVHTTYSLTTTSTGRLASKEPNVQNIPREGRFRRMYRARPGYILLEADYNSAELRMLAVVSGDRFLTGVFLDDKRNLHDEVSIAMYGPNFTQDERIRAKAINFGIPYGREAFSIAEEFNISTTEAQRLIEAWFERAPEAAKFLRSCREAATRGRTLVTVYGRKKRPGVVAPELLHELMNEYANFFMQSTVGDICTESAIELELSDRLWMCGASIVNLVHDSLLVEVQDAPQCIKEARRLLQLHMEGVAAKRLTTPIRFKVDFKQGTHWGLLKDQGVLTCMTAQRTLFRMKWLWRSRILKAWSLSTSTRLQLPQTSGL